METLVDRIEAAAARSRSVVFRTADPADTVRWDRLLGESRAVAAALAGRGVGPGSHIAVLGVTSRGLVTTIEGIWLAGGTLVVLPLPMRMSPSAYTFQIDSSSIVAIASLPCARPERA